MTTVTASGVQAAESANAAESVQAAESVDAADRHPLVGGLKQYAQTVLAPAVLTTDRERVQARTIDDLRRLGVLNHLAPTAYGGAGLDRSADRRLHELIAHADLNVWLIWAQHAATIVKIARNLDPSSATGHPLAGPVLRGEVLIGAAISDARHYPTRHLAARRADGGWLVNGTISWFSGWGLNDSVLIAAVDGDSEQVVLALIPLDEHFTAQPLDLRAVYGSRTERVVVQDAFLPDGHVLSVQRLAEWQRGDSSTASNAGGHLFGFGRRILDELADEPQAAAVVSAWSPYLAELRARVYTLADDVLDGGEPEADLQERLELKVRAGEVLITLSRALVIARAGRALPADNTAQLHARSALFLQVQGQNLAVRSRQLSRIAAAAPAVL